MSDQIIDEAALLAPLADGDGVGEDPRQDYSATAPYQKLRDARADARAHERNRDAPSSGDERGSTEADVANAWRDVRRIATDILESKAKDFEVAAWLTESLVRSDGLAGLAAGARLLAGLLEIFWEGGFPRPDEDGLEGRAAPIGGLAGGDTDGTIMQALRRTTLFVRPSGDPLALFQYEAAEDTAGIADEQRREQRYAQGILPFDAIHEESVTGRAALLSLKARAEAAGKPIQAFETIDKQVGILAGMSEADQLASLRMLLESWSDSAAELDQMVAAWASGDVQRLEELAVTEMQTETPALYEALLVRRNTDWADQIQTLLAGSGTVFIAVGAAHLAGDDSVQEILGDRGVTVTRE